MLADSSFRTPVRQTSVPAHTHLIIGPDAQYILLSVDSVIIQLHTLATITSTNAVPKTKYSQEPFRLINVSKCGRMFLLLYST